MYVVLYLFGGSLLLLYMIQNKVFNLSFTFQSKMVFIQFHYYVDIKYSANNVGTVFAIKLIGKYKIGSDAELKFLKLLCMIMKICP